MPLVFENSLRFMQAQTRTRYVGNLNFGINGDRNFLLQLSFLFSYSSDPKLSQCGLFSMSANGAKVRNIYLHLSAYLIDVLFS